MIKIKQGNLLEAEEGIIVHQVNVQGVMGGGVARQLAVECQGLESNYSEYCKLFNNDYKKLRGRVYFSLEYIKKPKIIANIFSQKPNFDTDYKALRICLTYIKIWAKKDNLSIAMPYKIGCGIAHGNWNEVYTIIEDVFSDYDVTLYKLEETRI